MDKTLFASHLRDLRTMHGMSAELLAEAAGVTVTEYRTWEDGTEKPTAEQMLRMAAALGIPAEDILYGGIRMSPSDTLSEEERRAEFEAHNRELERRYTRGKRYVIAIIILEVVGSLLNLLLIPSGAAIFALILAAVILVCLWNGMLWAKWAMIVLCGMSALRALFLLLAGNPFALIKLAYSIAVCVLLCANESVNEFLSYQNS